MREIEEVEIERSRDRERDREVWEILNLSDGRIYRDRSVQEMIEKSMTLIGAAACCFELI